jgi:Flp pilus assembly protein TadG
VKKCLANVCRNLACSTHGQDIAEFALILPLFFMLLIGIFWFGQAFRIYGTITNAARDGARAAVNPACTTCASQDPSTNAWNAIQNDLQAASINPGVLQQPATPPSLCACTPGGAATGCTSTTVACDGSQSNICVQGVNHAGGPAAETYVQLSSSSTLSGNGQAGGAGECGISVSFVYPYTFPLPFASIGNRTVNIKAQAQMRAETQ